MLSAEGLGRKKKVVKTYAIEHYNRPVSDYFKALTKANFLVTDLVEPEFGKTLLQKCPAYKAMLDHPTSLIFRAIKA